MKKRGAAVAVTGSVAFDYIMNFPGRFQEHILPDKLHTLNVSFLVEGLRRLHGGCAANIAYACSLHGLAPRLVASVGSDFDEYGKWLEAQGVDTRPTRRHLDLLTASCFITTDASNNQITGFSPGAMARARDLGLAEIARDKPALVTISPNDPEAMRRYPRECRELGIDFLFDPGQQTIALAPKDLEDGLRGARAVVMNDYECAMVSERTGRSIDDMLELAQAIVVTLGEEGSRIHVRGRDPIEVPPAPTSQVVDPTGCGDAFRGGLIRGLVAGLDWLECGLLGSLTGSYCVETRGPTSYRFTPAEFAARFEKSFARAVPAG